MLALVAGTTTPVSLLQRLRQPAAQAAWERFVQLYTPLLRAWAHRLGLRDGDCDDLVQDVFAVLVRKLPEFEYRPDQRFRGWLWTVLLNKYREQRRRLAVGAGPGEVGLDDLVTPGPTPALDRTGYRS